MPTARAPSLIGERLRGLGVQVREVRLEVQGPGYLVHAFGVPRPLLLRVRLAELQVRVDRLAPLEVDGSGAEVNDDGLRVRQAREEHPARDPDAPISVSAARRWLDDRVHLPPKDMDWGVPESRREVSADLPAQLLRGQGAQRLDLEDHLPVAHVARVDVEDGAVEALGEEAAHAVAQREGVRGVQRILLAVAAPA